MSSDRERPLRVCRVCRGPLEFSFTAREMYQGTRERFDYSTCRNCGCLQIDEIPKDPARFYGKDYFTQIARPIRGVGDHEASSIRKIWTTTRLAGGPLLRCVAGRRFGRFGWFTRTRTGMHDAILDVGCGSGRLLWHLHREGFQVLTGIDPNLGNLARGEYGPRFQPDSLEEHAGLYPLVMSHHSFEHVEDPRTAFAAFARIVEKDGWLLLRIPVADGWACGHYGSDWVQLDAPRHLHLHTRRSIDRLARDFGFRIAHVIDDSGAFQIWGSELYRRDVPLAEAKDRGRAVLGRSARWIAKIRAFALRARSRGDQACFYLQRIA